MPKVWSAELDVVAVVARRAQVHLDCQALHLAPFFQDILSPAVGEDEQVATLPDRADRHPIILGRETKITMR